MMVEKKLELLEPEKRIVMREVAETYGTPTYVWFESQLENNMNELRAIPALFGLTVRYAMKADSDATILSIFHRMGAHIDASSEYEVVRAISAANIPGERIRLTGQKNVSHSTLEHFLDNGVRYTATALSQLRTFGEVCPGGNVGIRFNVGISSGWTKATSTGGVSASFGIYEKRDQIEALLAKYNLTLDTVHLHIGSGSDPEKQRQATLEGLTVVRDFDTVQRLNMGGGIKVGRMSHESSTDIMLLGKAMADALSGFYDETGRKIHLEVEPGTALVANAAYIVANIYDIVDTGEDGFTFLKVDTGMFDNARPAMYGAEHPLYVINNSSRIEKDDKVRDTEKYVVVGPCCESGDILTPVAGQPAEVEPRLMHCAQVDDILVEGYVGAYGSSMACEGYNSFPKSPAVLVRTNGEIDLIRKSQPLQDLWKDEIVPHDLKIE